MRIVRRGTFALSGPPDLGLFTPEGDGGGWPAGTRVRHRPGRRGVLRTFEADYPAMLEHWRHAIVRAAG